ncbi:MAG: HIT family protein [Pseudobdellovibrio sp.]
MAAKKKKSTTSKKSSTKKKAKSLPQDWPQKRNLFFRPDRMRYVRKLLKQEGCVFCRSAQEEMSVDTLCVYKSKYSQIVLNKFPYNNGHLLVLPLAHGGELLELSDEQYVDLHLTLKKGIKAIQAVYQPTGFNVGLNHGTTGGAGIPGHLHYHIVPRWSGDLNFFPLIAETKLVIETVESTYQKFTEYFKENKV